MSVLNGLDTTLELTRHAGALQAQGNDFALRQYGWIQLLPARVLGADGIVPDVGPDAMPPDRDGACVPFSRRPPAARPLPSRR
jgi:hypothetical protein